MTVNNSLVPSGTEFEPVLNGSAAAGNIEGFVYTAMNAVYQGAITVTSQNIGAKKIVFDDTVSKVSIVGAGMVNNTGVAAKMFEALSDAHINIKMIATSEIKISVLVAQNEAEAAVVAIHDKFLSK